MPYLLSSEQLLLALVIALSSLAVEASPAFADTPIPSYVPTVIESPAPTALGRFTVFATAGDIDRDGINDVIAHQNQESGSGIGRVFIFSGRTRSVLLTIEDPEMQANARFGASAVGIGDVNADGVPDLAVSAPEYDAGGSADQGKAWVFSGKTGTALYVVDNPQPQSGAFFGAIFTTPTGDLDGDGVGDFIELAPGEDAAGVVNLGALYAFSGKSGSLLYRTANPTGQGGGFQNNLSATVPGDVNRDGVNDVLVGVSGTQVGNNTRQGRAFLLNGKTGRVIRPLDHPAPQAGAQFGAMIGNDPGAPGDVDGDGVSDVYVNADTQDVGDFTLVGASYIFSGANDSLIRTLVSPKPQRFAFFGFDFARAGDLNHDGTEDLLVTQTGCCLTGVQAAGSAWIFDLRTGRVLVAFDRPADQGAGQGIASPGDVNGDCFPDYFLGAPRAGTNNEGRVIVELSQGPPRASCATAPPPGSRPGPTPTAPFAGCPSSATNVIRGTSGADTRTGTNAGDRIFAGTGNDVVDALAGNDCVDLGPGDDRGQGGLGDDLILGGLGADRISGSSGNDRLRGNSRNDRIDAGRGNDRAFGDAGSDLIRGSFGNDRLHGVSGNDRLFGSRGRDVINGGSGRDSISAGSSNDRVAGDAGNDRINGNSGNDVLSGNSGNDTITGSTGADRISGGSGNDRINSRDGRRDRVSCGRGRDRVIADRFDRVARDCEQVLRR